MSATFESLETSIAQSEPVELYEFSYQSQTQYYTSTETNITLNGQTYTATPLQRSEVMSSSEIDKNSLKVVAPDQFPISLLFQAGPPNDVVTLVVKRVQLGALNGTNTVIIWAGRVMTVTWPPLKSELNCEALFTALRTGGLHRIYTVNCPYALYGSECQVIQSGFTTTKTDVTQSGNVLTSSSFNDQPSGYYAGGVLSWQYSPGKYALRGIKSHTQGTGGAPGTMEITYELPNFGGSETVTVTAGCDHTFSTCGSKFANQPNFGGFPYMTQKNPWGSNSVF